MTLAHFYDHTYYREQDGTVYSSGAFNSESWSRYLSAFDRVTVVANLSDERVDTAALNLVSRQGVNFQFVPNARELRHYLRYITRMTKLVEQIILAHDAIAVRLPSELGLVAIAAARKLGKPYAVEVVGCVWDAYRNHGTLKGKAMAPISYLRMRRALRNAPHVVYVTRYFLQQRYPTGMQSDYASNVVVSAGADRGPLGRRIRKLTDDPEVITLGLIGASDVRYKGHQQLLRAVAALSAELQQRIKIDFVGPGDQQWVFQLARELGLEERLTMSGKLTMGRAIVDYLDRIDLYVHPSLQEGLPRTVIEAMSRGLPVLASSIAGIPELLEADYLHRPGNVAELTDHLEEYLLRPVGERVEIAKHNFEKAKEYDHEILTRRLESFWKRFGAGIDR